MLIINNNFNLQNILGGIFRPFFQGNEHDNIPSGARFPLNPIGFKPLPGLPNNIGESQILPLPVDGSTWGGSDGAGSFTAVPVDPIYTGTDWINLEDGNNSDVLWGIGHFIPQENGTSIIQRGNTYFKNIGGTFENLLGSFSNIGDTFKNLFNVINIFK